MSKIINRLIKCEINKEIKNLSNYLLMQIIVNLKVCEKLARQSRRY